MKSWALAASLAFLAGPAAAQSMRDIIAGEIMKGIANGVSTAIKEAPARQALAQARAEAEALESQNAVLDERARELDAANKELEEQTAELERQLQKEEAEWAELERRRNLKEKKGELLENFKPLAAASTGPAFKGLSEKDAGRPRPSEPAFKGVTDAPKPAKAPAR